MKVAIRKGLPSKHQGNMRCPSCRRADLDMTGLVSRICPLCGCRFGPKAR